MSALYTLTYSASAKGWPSFYSYLPEFMVGMNQYLYSFDGGNLYRHNTNDTRNNFYGSQYSTIIKSVINQQPLENKLFKTLNLEGNAAWGAKLETDLQDTGFIVNSTFVKKEAAYFAFVRNSKNQETPFENPIGTSQHPLRSVQGIGTSSSTGAGAINYPLTFTIPKSLSVGDFIYHTPSTPTLVGTVTAIDVDLPNGINKISVSGSVPSNRYFFFAKNSIAESNGVLGHYCVFELTNSLTSKIELFATESEVMKSFP
tara:strand:+ start:8009 stop:8782 length:774 start_codon:yes stop_codon:yes gene_type:complete